MPRPRLRCVHERSWRRPARAKLADNGAERANLPRRIRCRHGAGFARRRSEGDQEDGAGDDERRSDDPYGHTARTRLLGAACDRLAACVARTVPRAERLGSKAAHHHRASDPHCPCAGNLTRRARRDEKEQDGEAGPSSHCHASGIPFARPRSMSGRLRSRHAPIDDAGLPGGRWRRNRRRRSRLASTLSRAGAGVTLHATFQDRAKLGIQDRVSCTPVLHSVDTSRRRSHVPRRRPSSTADFERRRACGAVNDAFGAHDMLAPVVGAHTHSSVARVDHAQENASTHLDHERICPARP